MFYRLLRQPFCDIFPEKCSWRHNTWETFCERYRMQCPDAFLKPKNFSFGVRKIIYFGRVEIKYNFLFHYNDIYMIHYNIFHYLIYFILIWKVSEQLYVDPLLELCWRTVRWPTVQSGWHFLLLANTVQQLDNNLSSLAEPDWINLASYDFEKNAFFLQIFVKRFLTTSGRARGEQSSSASIRWLS